VESKEEKKTTTGGGEKRKRLLSRYLKMESLNVRTFENVGLCDVWGGGGGGQNNWAYHRGLHEQEDRLLRKGYNITKDQHFPSGASRGSRKALELRNWGGRMKKGVKVAGPKIGGGFTTLAEVSMIPLN